MLWTPRGGVTLLGFLSSVLSTINAQNNNALPDILNASFIESLGNNSLFTRWRPTYHFSAPAGWMNDPCGMVYDPHKDTYHLMYQWYPHHVNWGNISWGHATSKDLISWTDVGGWEGNNAEALVTGEVGSYNGLGIFSGTAQALDNGTLLVFYTSVSKLPTNWQIPYQKGTETQSLAFSNDGGVTWEQYAGNPVIDSPPEGWNVTGWRDPFMEPWPEMDRLLGQSEPHWYATFGSGIKEVGPRMPFYSAPASDLTKWTFLGSLWEPAKNTSLGSPLETGSYAFNFEVSNFFSLEDEDGDVHYYVIMGTEGGNTTYHTRPSWGLWNEGIVTRRANGSAQFTPIAGGAIDSGLLYAVTSFNDTKNNRRVQWGWANEEMNNFGITQQGYQGAFAIPREMYVKKTTGLVNADGQLTTLGNNRLIEHANGTFTAYTLGARPLPEVVTALRQGATAQNISTERTFTSSMVAGQGSSHMELTASFRDFSGRAGLTVAASAGGEEYTNIYYDPSNHTINVDRSHSSNIEQFANYTVVGYFYPYSFASGKSNATYENGTSTPVTEDIVMQVYLDGSLLEVLVNDRFWLTTRIYPSRLCSNNFGIYVDTNSSVSVSNLRSWTGLKGIFPDRPANSSSELVWDSPEQTSNYTWWVGN